MCQCTFHHKYDATPSSTKDCVEDTFVGYAGNGELGFVGEFVKHKMVEDLCYRVEALSALLLSIRG